MLRARESTDSQEERPVWVGMPFLGYPLGYANIVEQFWGTPLVTPNQRGATAEVISHSSLLREQM